MRSLSLRVAPTEHTQRPRRTQQDVDLARRITEIAADHEVDADQASVSVIELGLDTARSPTIAPVWAALLTGSAEAQGRGTPSDEVRDATGRVPNLWFGHADEHETPRQRFHIEVYVAPEVAEHGSPPPSLPAGPSSMTATRPRSP